MQIYKILIEIIEKPHASKFYRDLRNYYKKEKMFDESGAIDYLISQKFEDKDDISSIDNTYSD